MGIIYERNRANKVKGVVSRLNGDNAFYLYRVMILHCSCSLFILVLQWYRLVFVYVT
jgi:hypothetical protein